MMTTEIIISILNLPADYVFQYRHKTRALNFYPSEDTSQTAKEPFFSKADSRYEK